MASNRIYDQLIHSLHKREVLKPDQVEELISRDYESSQELELLLLKSYSVTPENIMMCLAEHAQIPVFRLTNYQTDDDLIRQFPFDMLQRNKAVPVARTADTLTLALSDPLNLMAVEELGGFLQVSKVNSVASLEREIVDAIQRADTGSKASLDDILEQTQDAAVELSASDDADNVDIDEMLDSAEGAPVIRLVNMILVEAIRRGASDIHIEPFEKLIRLRYRVDGVLQEAKAPPKGLQNAIVSRLKVLSDLDIAERRIPQDGRFRIKALRKEIDLRVSMLPTVHGEKIVMRTLDKSNLAPDLESIGLDPDSLKKIRYAISQPHGLILVTGPTGSGKTTTLYSALQELNTSDVNIITVENPVEYQLHGINQVQTHSQVGMTFAAALRSILRQDPDIVLVGETRDAETALIAVEAALTGHLVMTTLHTNDAPGAIARLNQMGLEPFLIASALLLSQAQRLVRRICPACKEELKLTPEYLKENDIPDDVFEGQTIYKGKGCSRCNYSGYKGRASVMEVMLITQPLREIILKTSNADHIREVAYKEGMRDLRQNGWGRVIEGITTIEEVLRVTSGDS